MEKRPLKVIVLQKGIAHYREAFFDGLFAHMGNTNIDFELRYGVPRSEFARAVPGGKPFKLKYVFGKALWFPVLWDALKADMVIVEHSNKILINYILFLTQFLGGPKLGFWGHGRNHQTDSPDSLGERIKVWMGRHAHWYFAYTAQVRDELIDRGYRPERITDVQNAVAAPASSPSESDIEEIRRSHGIPKGAVVGFFCSQMYPKKRLDLLVEAALKVREKIPTFCLVLAGAGRSQDIAKDAAREHDFIYYVGPQFGADKGAFYALSRFVAFPGLLGLGIVDAFHYQVPAVVTDYRFHSPEISYLSDGENALLTEDSVEGLAENMIRICQDDELHGKLSEGCKKWSGKITIEAMSRKFAEGIEQAMSPLERS